MLDLQNQAAMIESRDPDLVQYLRESGKTFRLVDSADGIPGVLIEGDEGILTEATILSQISEAGIVLYLQEGHPGHRVNTDPDDWMFGLVIEGSVPPPTASTLLMESIPKGIAESISSRLSEHIPFALETRPAEPGFIRVLHLIAESDTPEGAEEAEWDSRDETAPDEDTDAEESGDNDPAKWEGAGEGFELDDQDFTAIEEAVAGNTGDLDPKESEFLTELGMIENGEATNFARSWLEKMKDTDREDELMQGREDGGTEEGAIE